MLMDAYNQGIIWLASYPKSGNTWFRVFLTYILNSTLNELNLQQQPLIGTGASARFLLDSALGFDSKLLHEDQIASLRPVIYEWHAQQPGVKYFKIHDANYNEKNKKPIISNVLNLGVIYFIRNPLDVVISFAHHMSCSIDEAIDQINSPSLALKGSATKPMSQVRQRCSSWSFHVKSWVDDPNFRRLIMRYEDMHTSALKTFSKALDFLHCPVDEELILQALERSQFEKLKKQEQSKGFKESVGPEKAFFRKGIIGDWVNTLNNYQIAKIIAHHGEMMRRFGYLNEQNQPLVG